MKLVEIKDHNLVTTSLAVAEKFGKMHKHVIRDIKNIVDQNWATHVMFSEGTHKVNGREYPMYYMNRDGFSLLVMGFTGKDAMHFKLEFINAFNQMEKQIELANQASYMIADPVERARKWADEQEEHQQQIAVMEPKAIFADSVATSNTSILVGELAKIISQNGVKIGAQRLFAWLRDNGYLIRRKGNDWNMPTQRSMEMKLFEIKETSIQHSSGYVSVNKTPKVTGKGQIYFINKLVNKKDD